MFLKAETPRTGSPGEDPKECAGLNTDGLSRRPNGGGWTASWRRGASVSYQNPPDIPEMRANGAGRLHASGSLVLFRVSHSPDWGTG